MSLFKEKPSGEVSGTSKEKAMSYARRAETTLAAPDQAMVYAFLALPWLKVAEIEGARVP